jgi:hypothetical protein
VRPAARAARHHARISSLSRISTGGAMGPVGRSVLQRTNTAARVHEPRRRRLAAREDKREEGTQKGASLRAMSWHARACVRRIFTLPALADLLHHSAQAAVACVW